VPFVRKFPLSVGVFWYRLAVEAWIYIVVHEVA
jgi:hypothetical protein